MFDSMVYTKLYYESIMFSFNKLFIIDPIYETERKYLYADTY